MNSLLDERTRVRLRHTRFLAAAVVLWFLLAYGLPFDPITVHGYAAMPPQGCPGQTITPNFDRTYRPPFYAKVRSMQLDTYLRNVETHWATPSENFEIDFDGLRIGRHVATSSALRSSPDRPGPYMIVSTITTTGRVLGIKRTAYESYNSTGVYQALPADDPECVHAQP